MKIGAKTTAVVRHQFIQATKTALASTGIAEGSQQNSMIKQSRATLAWLKECAGRKTPGYLQGFTRG
jgi:hypothetical protein